LVLALLSINIRSRSDAPMHMLVAVTLLAVFLAAVRWLVARSPELPPGDLLFFSIFAVLCLAILVSALPGALFVADAVLWLGVWFLRQRRTRRRHVALRSEASQSFGGDSSRD
jgi:hypothetical protein